MLPALAAASPTLRTSRPVSRLRRNHRHHHGVHLHLHHRCPSLAADGGGRGRFLLVGTYAASDGSAGQVHLLQTKDDDYKIIRKEARSSLVELSTDDSYHALIVDQGLVRIPLVGSSAYKAFRPQPHSWPSFPDGSEIQRSSRPSKCGATELLLGLILNEKKAEPDEAKINAMIGRSNQQFLARVGAIEFDYEGKEQSGSQRNDHHTILPWIDGVARLVLIIGLQDVSAIAKAAHAIGDASVNEHMRTSFMEAGAVKSLLQLLMHNDVLVREASAYALEKLSVSSKVCEKIRVEDGRELLVNVLKDSDTPVEQLEKIIHILSRILDMEVSMITAPDYYASTGSEDIVDNEKCSQGNVDGELNGMSQNLLKQDELDSCSDSIFDFDVISRLIKVLKESSPTLQEKCATLLEHLAAREQHGTAMTAVRSESVIEAVLEMGVIHGTTCNPENLDEPPTIMVEVSQAVGATVRLLTKLLNFDIFARSINSVRIVALLRRMLQSSVPLQSKDCVTACLIKLESRGLVDRSVGDIGMEITIYHTIPRLVEQMMTSFSSEMKRKAVIELNRIISGGVMEYTTAVATAGGIFPLVKMIEEGEGDVLEASLAVLYNLSLDLENHPPIIAAGAVPLLKRIVHVESPHWNRALQLLRTLPV
ncbi:hypothetical protein ACQJBY_026928 [Aegilops geniculata]